MTTNGTPYVVHICTSCGHRHFDHGRGGQDSCSLAWCPCRLTIADVQNSEPAQERVGIPSTFGIARRAVRA